MNGYHFNWLVRTSDNSAKKVHYLPIFCGIIVPVFLFTCTPIEFPPDPPEILPSGPVITLLGPDPYYLNIDDQYVEAGATALDSADGDITGSIIIDKTPNDINTSSPGKKEVFYLVINSLDDTSKAKRTVIIQEGNGDTEKPVITLKGDNPFMVKKDDFYSDAGATASDNLDNDISESIKTFGAIISTASKDTFTVWYMVLDNAGNVAYTTRTVIVTGTDVAAPIITLKGDNPVNMFVGEPYIECGATANDDVDGDVSGKVVIDNSRVRNNIAGSYTVTYTVSDNEGNSATKERVVNVRGQADSTKPVITLKGKNPDTLDIKTAYKDSGAAASDDFDKDISYKIVVSGSINTNVLGHYTLTYNVSDAAGNAADPVIRVVHVVDRIAPVITINSPNPVNIHVGVAYNETGATAMDNYDGDLTALLDTNASGVDVNTVGKDSVIYSVTDSHGNKAVKIRIVNVFVVPDNIKPVITLLGANPLNLTVGDTYTEPGYSAIDNIDDDITDKVVVTGVVNVMIAGTYTLRYNVKDNADNAADEKTRSVVVWTHSRSVTLNTTSGGANVGGNVVKFPVLLKLTSSNFTFSQAQSDGRDIRFAKSNGTTIVPYEIERWDASNRLAEIWVLVDTVYGNNSAQFFKMYWGNSSATAGSNSSAVFSKTNGFQGVWHLSEGTDKTAQDATGNNYDGTPGGAQKPVEVDGIIGRGKDFDGSSSYFVMKNTASGAVNFSQHGAYTLSAWANTDVKNSTKSQSVFNKGDNQYNLDISTGNTWEIVEVQAEESGWEVTRTSATVGEWTYVTGIRNGASKQYIFTNGVCRDSTLTMNGAGSVKRNETRNVGIGAVNEDVVRGFFNGKIDEVRAENVVRSKNWIRLCYENQKPGQSLVKQ